MKNVLTLTVANLGLYNAGVYKAKTLELPMDFEELGNILDSLVVGNNEELEIFDWEIAEKYTGLIEVSPYAQIIKLNELCEELEELADYEIELIGAISRTKDLDFEESKRIMEDVHCFKVDFNNSLSEEENVAYDYIEEVYGSVTHLSDTEKERYFDEDSFVRDIYISNEYELIFEDYDVDFDEMAEWEILDMIREWVRDIEVDCLNIGTYFDYESYGRDLLFDYTIDSETSLVVSSY